MNRQDYREAFDGLVFDEDFQEKTILTLRQAAERTQERKIIHMSKRRFTLIAAALSVALMVSAAAAVVMLQPWDVARRAGNETLAAAFEGPDAIAVHQVESVEDYDVELMGLVTGEGLDMLEELESQLKTDRTYAVLALKRADGQAIEEDVSNLTVTPLVEGYAPWQVNAWTLNGGACTFAENGVLYYLIECDTLEPFADHQVYLAVYPGTNVLPSAELFDFQDGVIDPKENVAMFSLALDPAKADPAKVEEMVGQFLAPVTSGDDQISPDDVKITSDGDLTTHWAEVE